MNVSRVLEFFRRLLPFFVRLLNKSNIVEAEK